MDLFEDWDSFLNEINKIIPEIRVKSFHFDDEALQKIDNLLDFQISKLGFDYNITKDETENKLPRVKEKINLIRDYINAKREIEGKKYHAIELSKTNTQDALDYLRNQILNLPSFGALHGISSKNIDYFIYQLKLLANEISGRTIYSIKPVLPDMSVFNRIVERYIKSTMERL